MPRYDDDGNIIGNSAAYRAARAAASYHQFTPAEKKEHDLNTINQQRAEQNLPPLDLQAFTQGEQSRRGRRIHPYKKTILGFNFRNSPTLQKVADLVHLADKDLLSSLRACWFALLDANELALPQHKLTDKHMAEFINLIYPPQSYPSKHINRASRWRNLYNATPPTLALPDEAPTPLDKPAHYTPHSHRYITLLRYVHPLPLPAHIKHRPTLIPNPLQKIYVTYRSTSKGRYGSPTEQIYPPPTTTAVLLPHNHRRANTPPQQGGFYPEHLTPTKHP